MAIGSLSIDVHEKYTHNSCGDHVDRRSRASCGARALLGMTFVELGYDAASDHAWNIATAFAEAGNLLREAGEDPLIDAAVVN